MPGDQGGYIDETHQRIVEFAEEFLDDDDERSGFIDGLMERRGYQRTSSWAAPDPQGGGQPRPGLLKPGGQRGGGQRGGSGGGGRPSGGGGYFRGR